MATYEKWYYGNDTTIDLTGFQDGVSSSYLNAATVTAVVKDLAGTTVISSQTLEYVAASNGNYRAVVDKASVNLLSVGLTYFVEITAAESGIDKFWRVPVLMSYLDT